jgi:hypothetical protein
MVVSIVMRVPLYRWLVKITWKIHENPSTDENWGTPILGNLRFKGGLIHCDTKRSQAEHLGATIWLYSTNIVGHMYVPLCIIMYHILLLRNY